MCLPVRQDDDDGDDDGEDDGEDDDDDDRPDPCAGLNVMKMMMVMTTMTMM